MTGELIIGIDVGTTAVKAAMLAPNGELLSTFRRSYPTQRGQGDRVEQNPSHWYEAVQDALQQFEPHLSSVAAIGLCSQVNTHVFIDDNGQALDAAIVWQDGRASEEAAELDAKVSEAEKLKWWGAPMPIDASNVLSRMLWMMRKHPDLWKQTRWVMLPKDYCQFQLTGQAATDPLSNIGLVDLQLNYIPEVFDLVPDSKAKFAPLLPVHGIIGEVRHGPAKGIPVVNCTMDAWTGLLGCGGHREGATAYLSGTSEILGIHSKTVNPTPGIIVFAECEGIRLHAGPTQSGGASQLWFAGISGQSPEEMGACAALSDFNRPAPLFVPHLQGERAPLWNANLRGMFIGLDHETQLPDLSRSVYEGVAFSVRQLLEALEASSGVRSDALICGGGGFRSDFWNQIRANILGRTLNRVAVTDPGISGAAAIAAFGVGAKESLQSSFDSFVNFDQTYVPDPISHEKYSVQFELYKQAIEANQYVNEQLVKQRLESE